MSVLPGEADGDRVLRALGRLGWHVVRQRGSHRKLVHHDHQTVLIIAYHRTIGRNTLRRILRQADLGTEEFLREFK